MVIGDIGISPMRRSFVTYLPVYRQRGLTEHPGTSQITFTLLQQFTFSSQSSEYAASDSGPNDLLLHPFGKRHGGRMSLLGFVFYPIVTMM